MTDKTVSADNRAAFLAWWCEDVPENLREGWKESVSELMNNGRASDRLYGAWEGFKYALTLVETAHLAEGITSVDEYKLMSAAAGECMSPEQLDLFSTLGDKDSDVYSRLFRCVVKRAASTSANVAQSGEPINPLYGPDTHVCWTPDRTPKEDRVQVVLISHADLHRANAALAALPAQAAEPKAPLTAEDVERQYRDGVHVGSGLPRESCPCGFCWKHRRGFNKSGPVTVGKVTK